MFRILKNCNKSKLIVMCCNINDMWTFFIFYCTLPQKQFECHLEAHFPKDLEITLLLFFYIYLINLSNSNLDFFFFFLCFSVHIKLSYLNKHKTSVLDFFELALCLYASPIDCVWLSHLPHSFICKVYLKNNLNVT